MRTRSTDSRGRPSILTLALLSATGLCLTPVPASAGPAPAEAPASAQLTRVEAIDVAKGGRTVTIRTSAAPEFSVFELTSPRRVLIDVRGAELEAGLGVLRSDGLVRGVRPSRFVAGAQPVARVEIELREGVSHRARADGRSVVVELEATPKTTARLGRLRARKERGRTLLRAPLAGATLSSDRVHLQTLASPSRLVVDLESVALDPKWQRIRVGRHGIRRARAGVREEGARVVLDLEPGADFPQVAVDVVGRELHIVLKDPISTTADAAEEVESVAVKTADVDAVPAATAPVVAPAVTAATVPVTAPETPAPTTQRAPKSAPAPVVASAAAVKPSPKTSARGTKSAQTLHRVENVRFEPKDGFYRLTVELAGAASAVAVKRGGTDSAPELRLRGAALPSALERTMDVTAVAGEALNSVSTFMDGSELVVAASILDATEHRHWRKGKRLMWDFRSAQPRVLDYEQESTASFSSEAAQTAGRLAPTRQRYSGRRISLDLKDADVQNVLRLLADVSKLNIVAADDVTGRITIKLRNVPWDQALDIILSSKQLDKTRNGNIIRVAPLSVLRKEEELRLARLQAQVQLEPLTVRLIPVSYAVASDVAPQVKALLTNRGDVNIDKRTNVLIVEDISDVLTKVERLVRTLDTQTPQVLIEARIVEARSNFSRELGIQWGGNASFTQNFGNQTGLSFPSNVRIAGGADDGQNQVTEGVLPNANYAVNLPATVGAGGGGALGFVFGSLNGGTLVNLRLSAAESTGKVKIVSAPKIVTLDNKEAKILSGERVPITVITANGPTTRFIDANIELKVLPHVTQDGSILMQIKARKNELSDRIDFLGVPGILTKEAETQMIVRDGDTAVLGGLYRRNSQENESYVPWIGKIPVLGWLFKTTQRNDARDELLIFISPRIVNRSAALIAPE